MFWLDTASACLALKRRCTKGDLPHTHGEWYSGSFNSRVPAALVEINGIHFTKYQAFLADNLVASTTKLRRAFRSNQRM